LYNKVTMEQVQARVVRKPGVALYYQIANLLQEQIASGQLRPGEKLPSEDELCKLFQVSRTTVRAALDVLASAGLVRREQGRGTYVEEPRLEQTSERLCGFTEEMRQKGLRPETKVLKVQKEAADELLAKKLNLVPGTAVIRIERLRLADGKPMGIQRAFIPSSLCPSLLDDDLSQSLYELLETKYNLIPHKAKDTYYVGKVSPQEAKLLGVPAGAAAFVVERVTVSSDGVPIEYVRSVMRGDRYRISLELSRDNFGK